MSVSDEIRQQRVANGSRRKRDLAAVGVNAESQVSPHRQQLQTWIDENLPGESYHVVSAARFHLRKQSQPINAGTIREFLRGRGWLTEQNS